MSKELTYDEKYTLLKAAERLLTEMDINLHEWQEIMDMMSFLAVDASFALWTNDIPPRLVTPSILAEAAGKELRVISYLGETPTQVGTAVVGKDGHITATITEDVPELRDGMMNAFSISRDGRLASRAAKKNTEFINEPDGRTYIRNRETKQVYAFYPTQEIDRKVHPPVEGLNKPLTIVDLEKIYEGIEKNEQRKFTTNMKIDGQDMPVSPSIDLENHPFFKEE